MEGIATNDKQLAAMVDAWAASHRDELVRDIIELVRIPSVTGEAGCAAAEDRLQEMACHYGFDTERDEDFSVSILHSGTEGTRELGILGHLDVVPAGSGWRYAPFEPVEKDGWLIGRGSSDNKGPVVMSLYVLRCLRDLDVKLRSTVRLMTGCREETDMEDVRRYLRNHEPPAYTLNCDGAWAGCIGEKGILEADLVVPVCSGNLTGLAGGASSNMVPDYACAEVLSAGQTLQKVEAYGKAAHCCVPQRGENAICKLLQKLHEEQLLTEDAAAAVDCLHQCFSDSYGTGLRIHHEDALSGKTTCVPSLISMENGMIRLHFNARTALSQQKEWILHALEKRISKLNIQLENIRWVPPRRTPADLPEIRLLVDTCRQFLNPKFKPYVMGGATYSRVFPRSLPFGPEVMDPRSKRPFGRAHEADEAVCIAELLQAIKVYVIALKRLDEWYE